MIQAVGRYMRTTKDWEIKEEPEPEPVHVPPQPEVGDKREADVHSNFSNMQLIFHVFSRKMIPWISVNGFLKSGNQQKKNSIG